MKDCERALSQEPILVYAFRLHTKILAVCNYILKPLHVATLANTCERPARPSIFSFLLLLLLPPPLLLLLVAGALAFALWFCLPARVPTQPCCPPLRGH